MQNRPAPVGATGYTIIPFFELSLLLRRAVDRIDTPLLPIQQRGPECPFPDREETRKPGVSDGSPIGPRTIFEAFIRQELLITAMQFGCGTNVAQDIPGAGSVCIGC